MPQFLDHMGSVEQYETVTLALSSRDCTTGSPFGGPCTFNLSEKALVDVIGARVKQVGVELSFYNFESDANGGKNWDANLYLIGDVSGPVVIPIVEGAYSISELTAYLQAQILAVTGTTVTVTNSATTEKLTITITAGTDSTFQIDYAAAALAGKTYGLTRLGFTTPAAPAASVVADQAYVLTLTESFHLKSTVFSTTRNLVSGVRQGQSPGIKRDSIIYQVMIGQNNSWTFCFNQIPSNWMNLDNVARLTDIDFRLTDDKDFDIILHQRPYTITMEFKTKRGTY